MTLWIILASIAAYLAVGLVFVAPRWAARETENDIRQWSSIAKPDSIAEWRHFNAGIGILVGLVWPFWLVTVGLVGWVAGMTPLSSRELELVAKEQAKRIAELERELGINQTGRGR